MQGKLYVSVRLKLCEKLKNGCPVFQCCLGFGHFCHFKKFTEDGTKISVRPSGTEPKIKFYFELAGSLKKREDYDAVEKLADEKIEAIMKDLDL